MSSFEGHTPGPWRLGIKGSVVSDSAKGLPETGGFLNCEYYGGNLIAESVINEANARLIAAAPEFLALLEDLCRFNDECLASTDRKSASAHFESRCGNLAVRARELMGKGARE